MAIQSDTAIPLSSSPVPKEALLRRAVAEVIPEEELIAKLESGRPLRLKQGFDPTRPELHLGHAVGLRKLRQFQRLGHRVVLIVGDWTAQIGDPSMQSATRVMLTAEEVRQNAQRYMDLFFRIVDRNRTEVRYQSDWFGKFNLSDVLYLTAKFTVAQILEREDFTRRFKAGVPISLVEFLYPLLQAYDSVATEADVEFGGTDQKFNILTGRELQRMVGQEPQSAVLVKMLPGLDGTEMHKSKGNYISMTAAPEDMYGKVMSLRDDLMESYFEALTDVPMEEVREMLAAAAAGRVNPMEVKMRLAREIVSEFHSPEAAARAEEEFIRVFRRREAPTQVPECTVPGEKEIIGIVDLVVHCGLAKSKSEAKRLVEQGAVDLGEERVRDPRGVVRVLDGALLRVGKLGVVRLRLRS